MRTHCKVWKICKRLSIVFGNVLKLSTWITIGWNNSEGAFSCLCFQVIFLKIIHNILPALGFEPCSLALRVRSLTPTPSGLDFHNFIYFIQNNFSTKVNEKNALSKLILTHYTVMSSCHTWLKSLTVVLKIPLLMNPQKWMKGGGRKYIVTTYTKCIWGIAWPQLWCWMELNWYSPKWSTTPLRQRGFWQCLPFSFRWY